MYQWIDNSRIHAPWHTHCLCHYFKATKFLLKTDKFCGIRMLEWDASFKSWNQLGCCLSWPFCKLGVSNHGRDISCLSLMAFAAFPGVRKDFRGQGYVKYWHSGPSVAWEPRRNKGGIMLVSWSQAAMHSSMLPLLPRTDISYWHGDLIAFAACCDVFVSVFEAKTMLSSLVFFIDLFIIEERFSYLAFFIWWWYEDLLSSQAADEKQSNSSEQTYSEKGQVRKQFGIPRCRRLVKKPLRPFNWSQLEVTVNSIPLRLFGGHRSLVL